MHNKKKATENIIYEESGGVFKRRVRKSMLDACEKFMEKQKGKTLVQADFGSDSVIIKMTDSSKRIFKSKSIIMVAIDTYNKSIKVQYSEKEYLDLVKSLANSIVKNVEDTKCVVQFCTYFEWGK